MKNSLSHSLIVVILVCAGTMSLGGTASAATAGGKCTKVGSTQTTKGVKYKCTKSGKSLSWVAQKIWFDRESGSVEQHGCGDKCCCHMEMGG